MHLVFVTLGYHPELIGGAFRYVAEVASRLAVRGHKVDAVFPSDRREGPASLKGVVLHRLWLERGAFWQNWMARNRAARVLIGKIRRENSEAIVVSCHGYFARTATAFGGPLVSLFTGPWAEEFLQSRRGANMRLGAALMRRMERAGLKRSAVVVTISEYYRSMLPKWHEGLPTPIHVVGGGVDLDEFRPADDRARVRREFGVGEGEFVFLVVRRLEPRMGLIELVEAFERVNKEFPKARLWIAGDGSMRPVLEERVKSNPAARLLGFVSESELPLRYAAADCTVMPSLDLEGFGLSTVESLACGTPVIGSRAGATPEILGPLNQQLLYESSTDLCRKLRATVAAPEVLPTRSECRDYANLNFSWDRVVKPFENICAEVLRKRAA